MQSTSANKAVGPALQPDHWQPARRSQARAQPGAREERAIELLEGVGITEARKQKYDFSDPYIVSKAVLVVKDGNEDIKSFEDLKGKKMRFFGLGAKVMQKLGVDTQLLAGADIYPALERGTIDATEFSMPAIDLNLGFYQVAKHYYFPGWHQQSTMFELMINMDKWNAMSASQQKLITTTCRANIALGLAEGEAIQGKALAELKEKGVQIHRWPQEILDTLEVTWNEVAAEQAAADPTFKETWESLQAFRAEYAVWAELGYLK